MKEKWFIVISFVVAVFAAQATLIAAVWSFDAVQPAEKSPDVPQGYPSGVSYFRSSLREPGLL